MIKFKSSYSFALEASCTALEKVNKVSQTIQGEAYTIQELFAKYAQGTLDLEGKQPVYNGLDLDQPDMEKVGNLDLVEKSELVDSNTLRVNELKEKMTQKVSEPIPEPEKIPNKPEKGD